MLDLVFWVLVADGSLTAVRGLDFLRYVFTESAIALFAVVFWLLIAAMSFRLSWLVRKWVWSGSAPRGSTYAAVVYAYLLFPLAFGLTLEFVGDLLGIAALRSGGEESSGLFTAIGLSVSGISLALMIATIVTLMRRHAS